MMIVSKLMFSGFDHSSQRRRLIRRRTSSMLAVTLAKVYLFVIWSFPRFASLQLRNKMTLASTAFNGWSAWQPDLQSYSM